LENSIPPLNRMVASEYNSHFMVSSTATSKETIVNSISEVQSYADLEGRDLKLLIGGKARTTCGKVDYDGLSEVLKAQIRKGRKVALYGELGLEMEKRGCGSPYRSKEAALGSLGNNPLDVILACTN